MAERVTTICQDEGHWHIEPLEDGSHTYQLMGLGEPTVVDAQDACGIVPLSQHHFLLDLEIERRMTLSSLDPAAGREQAIGAGLVLLIKPLGRDNPTGLRAVGGTVKEHDPVPALPAELENRPRTSSTVYYDRIGKLSAVADPLRVTPGDIEGEALLQIKRWGSQ
jgi:hypothetical protein